MPTNVPVLPGGVAPLSPQSSTTSLATKSSPPPTTTTLSPLLSSTAAASFSSSHPTSPTPPATAPVAAFTNSHVHHHSHNHNHSTITVDTHSPAIVPIFNHNSPSIASSPSTLQSSTIPMLPLTRGTSLPGQAPPSPLMTRGISGGATLAPHLNTPAGLGSGSSTLVIDDLNPMEPCGACNEWLKKIGTSPSFPRSIHSSVAHFGWHVCVKNS
jgi:hypothetical protein